MGTLHRQGLLVNLSRVDTIDGNLVWLVALVAIKGKEMGQK